MVECMMTDRRLSTLLFPPPAHQTRPWGEDLIAAVSPRHDLRMWDPNVATARQFQGIDAILDFGGANGTREMADLAAGSVKLWQIIAVGYDKFDLEYWRKKKIPVSNCPGQLSAVALAECAMMLMIMLARHWTDAQASLKQRKLFVPVAEELEGQRLLVIGLGASGRELARRAHCFGMRVSAIDVRPISPPERAEYGLAFAGTPQDLGQLLSESDYASLHVPLTPDTRQMINARSLRLMKPTSRLINVARGPLIDEQALEKALQEGWIAGAGLDVFESEPVNPESPLLKLPNVIGLPHVAGTTYQVSKRRAAFAAENLDLVAAGKEPRSRIDRQREAGK
jgi:phosphoglycerate dehydrogenase-like enzyme